MVRRHIGGLALLFATAFALAAGPAQGQDAPRLKLEDTITRRGLFRPRMPRFSWSEDGKLIRRGSDLIDPRTGKVTGKSEAGSTRRRRRNRGREGEIGTRVSPDGAWAAFVREDKNLYLRRTETDEVRALTEDASSELLYGRLDWVYQEEVFGRGDFNGMWWSPDSKRLAFLRIDESPVKEFTVVDHIPTTLKVEVTNYPKAGDPNPVASLAVYDVAESKTIYLDLSKYAGDDIQPLIVHVGWTPSGDKVVFQIQDRLQTWLELVYGNPATGAIETVIREESEAWVNRMSQPRWLGDGTFLWWSERDGYKHLYHYRADGELITQITRGPWVNQDVIEVDEDRGLVWFRANRDGAVGRHAYRIGLDGENLVHLTPGRGWHDVSLNHDGSLLLDRHSSLENPGRVVLRDATGKVLRVLAEARFEPQHAFQRPELVEIEARDGFKMDATILRPVGFDERRAYPVMLLTYSGPDAPSVRDRWGGAVWQQFLSQEGIIVFQVNNRSSSGKGQVTTATCYKRFGVAELADLEDAVGWLTSHPWADASRVGISGWSYGGFMAAYALTHSKAFALGIAGAGVYDWRDYDTIYTERYMSTPQKNAEGYDAVSCVGAAKDLHGHLQLIHGTMDDNVHMQNTLQFAYELQKAGKDFEMMLYPRSRHGVRHPRQRLHLRRLNWRAIKSVLLDGNGRRL